MANRTDFPSSSRVDLSTEEDQKTTEIKERCHSRDLGIEGEEKFEILGGESQATPENKLQFSSFEDGYEIIEVSDLDRIQIAGFSKQKLLEMCNFCKISYGNNDEKLDSRYKTKAELINEGYSIIPFYYNGRNKRCAGFVFTKDKEITIAYRGTKDFDDVMTDVSAAFTPEFLPEGGKMHSGFYNAFKDSWSSLGRILEDHAKKQLLEIKDFRINCTGHSMGAALATITALYLKKVKSAEHVRVATFGSPRVFDSRGAEIYEKLLGENTIRVTNLSDPIPMFPSGSMGFKHVGKPLKIKTGNFVINCFGTSFCIVGEYYHKTDTYYSCIQDMKPEDFQSNNSVSRYYYLSYVAAVPYYITTTALTIPYYLFPSAISNTEQRYFEREMMFADDRRLMSLKDNKNGLVIHALGNAMVSLENPLVISHIECNINGRGEGLKFNIYDIASFVNSNYHLNRNNMRLRQLCETEDVSNLISAENHVLGKNAASNLVNKLAVPGKTVSDERSQHPKSKSQQPQKNVVDKRKNIMDNRNASTKHPISNNYKEGEMHGSDQDTKSIEERLLGAIESIDVNQVKGLVEKDTNITESILSEALKKANERIINLKKDSKKKNQKDRLTQIIKLLEEKLKSIGGAAPSVDDSAATGSQSASIISSDGEEKQTPDQPTTGEITLQMGDEPRLESKGDQLDSPSHSSGSSLDSDYSKLESSNGQSGGKCARTPSDSNGDSLSFEEIDEEPVVTMTDSEDSSSECSEVPSIGNLTNDEAPLLDKENSTLEGDSSLQQDTQPKTLVPSGGAGSVVTEGDQPAPTPTPEPTLSSTSKKSEQVNNTTPPNTKSSNLHIIAASVLAIAGVALGVAIAVHLEMLAVGIAVGACCLVAAAVIYYCAPKSSVENSKVEKVALDEEKGPVATPV
ncbi:MAG: lipase family protein [Wolbachia endosymbiont of Menacanthus eurysternus]|nr:lipase family protein [Wolbachia endosymbiont of Menacanthus eurysternus]